MRDIYPSDVQSTVCCCHDNGRSYQRSCACTKLLWSALIIIETLKVKLNTNPFVLMATTNGASTLFAVRAPTKRVPPLLGLFVFRSSSYSYSSLSSPVLNPTLNLQLVASFFSLVFQLFYFLFIISVTKACESSI